MLRRIRPRRRARRPDRRRRRRGGLSLAPVERSAAARRRRFALAGLAAPVDVRCDRWGVPGRRGRVRGRRLARRSAGCTPTTGSSRWRCRGARRRGGSRSSSASARSATTGRYDGCASRLAEAGGRGARRTSRDGAGRPTPRASTPGSARAERPAAGVPAAGVAPRALATGRLDGLRLPDGAPTLGDRRAPRGGALRSAARIRRRACARARRHAPMRGLRGDRGGSRGRSRRGRTERSSHAGVGRARQQQLDGGAVAPATRTRWSRTTRTSGWACRASGSRPSIRTPTYEVSGMTLPGVPVVILGRGADVAWAMTNLYVDDVDLFVERLDASGDAGRARRRLGADRGRARDDPGQRRRGGRVRDPVDRSRPLPRPDPERGLPARSVAWSALEPRRPVRRDRRVAQRTSVAEVPAAIAPYVFPPQNLVVGDRGGHDPLDADRPGARPLRLGRPLPGARAGARSSAGAGSCPRRRIRCCSIPPEGRSPPPTASCRCRRPEWFGEDFDTSVPHGPDPRGARRRATTGTSRRSPALQGRRRLAWARWLVAPARRAATTATPGAPPRRSAAGTARWRCAGRRRSSRCSSGRCSGRPSRTRRTRRASAASAPAGDCCTCSRGRSRPLVGRRRDAPRSRGAAEILARALAAAWREGVGRFGPDVAALGLRRAASPRSRPSAGRRAARRSRAGTAVPIRCPARRRRSSPSAVPGARITRRSPTARRCASSPTRRTPRTTRAVMPGGQSGHPWDAHYDDQLEPYLANRLHEVRLGRRGDRARHGLASRALGRRPRDETRRVVAARARDPRAGSRSPPGVEPGRRRPPAALRWRRPARGLLEPLLRARRRQGRADRRSCRPPPSAPRPVPSTVDELARPGGDGRRAGCRSRPPRTPRRPEIVAAIRGARGVFLDRRRPEPDHRGAPRHARGRGARARSTRAGGVIGGTSAGTACMSDPMITGEGDFTPLVAGSVEREARARPRRRRSARSALRRAAAAEPAARLGARAARSAGRRRRRADGSLGPSRRHLRGLRRAARVEIYDAAAASDPRRRRAARGTPLAADGVRVHVLRDGDRFDPATAGERLPCHELPRLRGLPRRLPALRRDGRGLLRVGRRGGARRRLPGLLPPLAGAAAARPRGRADPRRRGRRAPRSAQSRRRRRTRLGSLRST